MLIKTRIPTTTYGFVEGDLEYDSIEDAITDYDRLVAVYEQKEGLGVKEWARVRDLYYNTGELNVEEYEQMNKAQKYVINEMKLAIRSNKE